MREDDRQRPRAATPLVDEVDAEPVEVGAELGQGVEIALDRAPVEPRDPVVDERAHGRHRNARVRVTLDGIVRPARGEQAAPQVLEDGVGYLDAERLDAHGCLLRDSRL